MKEVTLQVNGREMTFSMEELTAIVEEQFARKITKQVQKTEDMVKGPAEGEWFKVNPETINKELFKEEREDSNQENARMLIIEAFFEVKRHPEKYAKPFKTIKPRKVWVAKTVKELGDIVNEFGDHMTNWIEIALEWAQRIHNGESWEAVCNDPDAAKFFRLVVWKNGYMQLVGGSAEVGNKSPASYVHDDYYSWTCLLSSTVPSVTDYE